MADRLKDKVAVITGAASGIGRATVDLFVAEGARVIAADLQDEKGEALAKAHPGRVIYRRADVAVESEVEALTAAAVSAFGRIDCLYNNAGFSGAHGPIETLDFGEYDRTMGVLLRGVFAGFKHVVPVMKRQSGGVILSTASIAGLQGGIGPHVYSAAKAAVIQLTRSAALELAPHNIRVNCLCPGAIATPIFGRSLGLTRETADRTVPRLETVFKDAQPLPRPGLPEDVAEAALYLTADSGRFVSGHALVIDGALTAGPAVDAGGSAFEGVVAKIFDPAHRKKG